MEERLQKILSRHGVASRREAERLLAEGRIRVNGNTASLGDTADEAEDVIEIPRQVARNEIALFFYQIPDRTHETRVSIRTRAPWDATVLAGRFGGGGHVRAAGCTTKGGMAVAKRQMRRAVRGLLKGDK